MHHGSSVLVIGDAVVGGGLARALRTLGYRCRRAALEGATYPDLVSSTLPRDRETVIVDLVAPGSTPRTLVARIHHLRARLRWVGLLVLVPGEPRLADVMEDLSLTGEPHTSRSLFRNLPGHELVRPPLLLGRLISLIERAEWCFKETWAEMVEGSALDMLANVLREPLQRVSTDTLQSLLGAISAWPNWRLLVPHQYEPMVRELLSSSAEDLADPEWPEKATRCLRDAFRIVTEAKGVGDAP